MARKQTTKKIVKSKTKAHAKKAKKSAAKPTAKKKSAKAAPKRTAKTVTKTTKKAAKSTAKRQTKAPTKAPAEAAIKAPEKVVAKPTPKSKLDFKLKQFVVYPAHGVGQITDVEEQEVAGTSIELFVVLFDKDKMTLRVPTAKAKNVGMRSLSSLETVKSALETLKGRARIKRTMWSRRAQEYEAKINSGDLISIAEVVRDLHRAGGQPEQSYSERQLYEAALDRMAREVGAVEKLKDDEAIARVEVALEKAAAAQSAAAQTNAA